MSTLYLADQDLYKESDNLSLFLLGVGIFLLEWIIELRQCLTYSSLLSCFVSSSVNIVSINCNQCYKKERENFFKRGRERPILLAAHLAPFSLPADNTGFYRGGCGSVAIKSVAKLFKISIFESKFGFVWFRDKNVIKSCNFIKPSFHWMKERIALA